MSNTTEQCSLRNISRQPLKKLNPEKATLEEIKISALVRIADASEIIAANYLELIQKVKKLDSLNNQLNADNQKLKKSVANQQSLITKMTKKLEVA